MIGDDIIITVVRVHGDGVSLGFQCPDDIRAGVEDLYQSCHKQQLASCRTEPCQKQYAHVDLG